MESTSSLKEEYDELKEDNAELEENLLELRRTARDQETLNTELAHWKELAEDNSDLAESHTELQEEYAALQEQLEAELEKNIALNEQVCACVCASVSVVCV